ncbi:MAG TPA: ACT domain-containing protein [Gammaproteobacteria bacterium]|nr:ACT domain-containing protein [Gammaproteobacteria bacterium]
MQDKQYLSIAAIFASETETLREIAHLIAHHQCDILDWRLYQHGDRHNLHFLIGGTWAVIAKLEPKLNTLAKKKSMQILMERTNLKPPQKNFFPYNLYIIAEDNPENFHQIMRYLVQPDIFIHEINIDTYKARYTETPMLSITIKIQFSVNLSISEWREHFMLFCDDMNFDSIMEPEKT